MLDAVEVTLVGGAGGHGLVSYHREKFVPQGGPDGGDGGRGGRIYLRAVDDAYTLELYRAKHRFQAANGVNGGPNLRHGANAPDMYLDVPAGTFIIDSETGDLIADLTEPGQEVLVAHGGRGGWGNKRFASATNKTPSYSQKGQNGEEVVSLLELRMLADVGLLGLPNAGKSTLLANVSKAKPKIASYPFTTLEPMLGVVIVAWERFTLADLPGLVEGASEGYGLGFEFLKHVRRCRVLLHVVDCSSPDPVTDYELIEGEVRAYDPGLASIPRVIAVTKADLDMETAVAAAATLAKHVGQPVRVVSADEGTGTLELMAELMAIVRAERLRPVQPVADAAIPTLRPGSQERFALTAVGDGRWEVEGGRVVTFVEMMDTEMEGSYDEVLRRLERWGIAKALRRAGAKLGDTIVFGETTVEWQG